MEQSKRRKDSNIRPGKRWFIERDVGKTSSRGQ